MAHIRSVPSLKVMSSVLILTLALLRPQSVFSAPRPAPPNDKVSVCLKTFSLLIENTKFRKMDLGQIVSSTRKLRMELNPLAEPSYASISGSHSSSKKDQEKVAERLRGIEVYGLKMGEGASLLDPSAKTLGMIIEGRQQIEDFFKDFDDACTPQPHPHHRVYGHV